MPEPTMPLEPDSPVDGYALKVLAGLRRAPIPYEGPEPVTLTGCEQALAQLVVLARAAAEAGQEAAQGAELEPGPNGQPARVGQARTQQPKAKTATAK